MSYARPKIMAWEFDFPKMKAKVAGATYELFDVSGVLCYRLHEWDIKKTMCINVPAFDNAVKQAYTNYLFERDVLNADG